MIFLRLIKLKTTHKIKEPFLSPILPNPMQTTILLIYNLTFLILVEILCHRPQPWL